MLLVLSFTNRVIERDLRALPPASWIQLRLNILALKMDNVLQFLDLPYFPLRLEHRNRNPVEPYRQASWTIEEFRAFDRWCSKEMDRWFGGWREQGIIDAGAMPNGQEH